RDDAGRDVTDLVRDRDGRYLDTFALGDYQGLARDHWVELDLGPTLDALADEGIGGGDAIGADGAGGLEARGPRNDSRDGPLVLLAQGWIYPTDSSINVAIGQGRAAAPSPLVIEIPNGASGWRPAGAPLGFPAGKHKSMLIDLAGLDPDGGPAPRRLRLRTNLEIYWDHLALAARVPDASLRITELAPDRADLAYRGFSVTSHFGTADPAPRRRPEIPLYDRIAARRPQWIDLGGYYTRFGDVRDLLAHTDDRTVILNAGDEIRLSFPVPPGPPAGWARRFVFVSDGWEKDGDLNTAYGATVLPLPSHDQPQYADPAVRGPVGNLTDDPVYRRFPEDWQTYHTRYVSQQRWPNPLYR
ncbi:MAG TPA: hypothetical protein VMP03_11760, partial [Methylomirabilota bacterium]|nr:hypothetical protein [Methylomirabilota bacterium]